MPGVRDGWITEAWYHGSVGNMDYIHGYSDVDALIVLDAKAVESPEALQEVHRRVLDISRNLYIQDPPPAPRCFCAHGNRSTSLSRVHVPLGSL